VIRVELGETQLSLGRVVRVHGEQWRLNECVRETLSGVQVDFDGGVSGEVIC